MGTKFHGRITKNALRSQTKEELINLITNNQNTINDLKNQMNKQEQHLIDIQKQILQYKTLMTQLEKLQK